MTDGMEADKTALSPGSDLWIVPEKEKSNFAQKLDWYLNFQIAKSTHHQRPKVPHQIIEILKNCELENFDWATTSEEDPLLVLASPYLPCRWVMVVPQAQDLQTWTRVAFDKWKKMNSPSVRVFLPHKISPAQFETVWKKLGGTDAVVVVTDREDEVHG